MLQMILLFLVCHYMIFKTDASGDNSFKIVMASNIENFVVRFISCLMMHWNVKVDVEQGLNTMKHVVKHPSQFMNANLAFMVGFWQFSGGLLSEVLCLLFLSQQLNTSEIIVRSAAFGAIA
jgi:hypothetical protein